MLSLIFPHQQHGEGIVVGSDYEIYKKVVLSGELKGTNMHDFNVIDSGETVLTLTRVPGNSTLEQSAAVGFDGNCSAGWEVSSHRNLSSSLREKCSRAKHILISLSGITGFQGAQCTRQRGALLLERTRLARTR